VDQKQQTPKEKPERQIIVRYHRASFSFLVRVMSFAVSMAPTKALTAERRTNSGCQCWGISSPSVKKDGEMPRSWSTARVSGESAEVIRKSTKAKRGNMIPGAPITNADL